MYPILFVVLVFVLMIIGAASIASSQRRMVESSMKLPPPIVKTTVHSVKMTTDHNEHSDGRLPGEKLEDLSDFRNSGFLRYPSNVTNSYDYSHDLSVNHDYSQLSVHPDENEDFLPDFVDYTDS